jgi:hypothetical protein
VPRAIAISLLMRGLVYQGCNAIVSSFLPELFLTRVRVTAMAVAQKIGTASTALLPALFASVAPPGADNIPLTVGAIALEITVIATLPALSAREADRMPIEALGRHDAAPMAEGEYRRLRAGSASAARPAVP